MYDFLNQPVRLGSLEIPNRVILAPLARVSDVPYRRICQQMGAGLTYIEMLAANALLRETRRTMDTLSRHESESTLGVQVTGKTPEEVAAAIRVLDEDGYDTIDINMGCPVRKVVSKGWGSAMLREPERLSETVRQARAATQKPLSVKIRIGYCGHSVNVQDNAARIAREGVDMLTVHGRTRAERYDVPADLRMIRAGLDVAKNVSPTPILTCGNGDVLDLASTKRMFEQTQCDAVMVSRGALGNPWIFPELLGHGDGRPELAEWLDVLFRHMDYHEEFYGSEKQSVVIFRKHLLWYATGFPGIRRMRNELGTTDTFPGVRSALKSFAGRLPPAIKRYDDPDPQVLEQARDAAYDPKFDMDREADRAVAEEGLSL